MDITKRIGAFLNEAVDGKKMMVLSPASIDRIWEDSGCVTKLINQLKGKETYRETRYTSDVPNGVLKEINSVFKANGMGEVKIDSGVLIFPVNSEKIKMTSRLVWSALAYAGATNADKSFRKASGRTDNIRSIGLDYWEENAWEYYFG